MTNPAASVIDGLLNHSPILVAIVTVAALLTYFADKRKRGKEPVTV